MTLWCQGWFDQSLQWKECALITYDDSDDDVVFYSPIQQYQNFYFLITSIINEISTNCRCYVVNLKHVNILIKSSKIRWGFFLIPQLVSSITENCNGSKYLFYSSNKIMCWKYLYKKTRFVWSCIVGIRQFGTIYSFRYCINNHKT